MKIVVIGQQNNDYTSSDVDMERIRAAAGEHTVEFHEDTASFGAALKDADVAVGYIKSAKGIELPAKLKWFHSWSAGLDGEPIDIILDKGATVTSSKSNGAIPIAEQTILLMLMVTRKAWNWIDAQRRHEWHRQMSPELHGKTLGLVGLGNIGTEVARRAKAFGMKCVAVRRHPGGGTGDVQLDSIVGPEGLNDVLAQSDYVVVTAPLTPETRGMLGEEQFRKMKSSAIYICVSRGAVADTAALEKALREGWIAGAGLDTHATEPLPADSPFWDMPNTIVTPHNGGTTMGTSDRAVDVIVENLERWRRGETLKNIVDGKLRY